MSQTIIDPNKLFTCFCSVADKTVYLYFDNNNIISTTNILKQLAEQSPFIDLSENNYVTMQDEEEFSSINEIILNYKATTQNAPYFLINYLPENGKLYLYLNKEGIYDLINSLNALLKSFNAKRDDDISYMIEEWGQDSCILQNYCLINNSIVICHLRLYGKLYR